MTTQTEVLKLALEGAANYIDVLGGDSKKYRQLLAQQSNEQVEPVAWMSEENDCLFFDKDKPYPMAYDFWTPLYTHPPVPTAQPNKDKVK